MILPTCMRASAATSYRHLCLPTSPSVLRSAAGLHANRRAANMLSVATMNGSTKSLPPVSTVSRRTDSVGSRSLTTDKSGDNNVTGTPQAGGSTRENCPESDDSHPVMSHSSLLQRAQRAEEAERGGSDAGKDGDTDPDGQQQRQQQQRTPPLSPSRPDQRRPVCLVVGAGLGIGTAVAHRFAREGYAVAAARRDGQSLRGVVGRIRSGGDVDDDVPIVPYQCDAREEEEVVRLFADVVETLGHIDVCIFNIGSNISYPVVETTARKFKKCWEMGCYSGFLVGREAARHMLKHREAGGKGTIIFTGATASMRGAANFSAFAVTKMGLRALAQSMARELGPEGIHVAHVVIDGVVDTPWIRKNFADALERLPPDGICKPEEIAETYWQLSRQHQSAWTHEVDLRPYSERF